MTKDIISTAVQVALRIRPLTDRDRAQPRFANLANDDVLKIVENNNIQVIPYNKQFRFDHVFNTESRQQDIFSNVGDPLVRKFVEGYNVTILAYGQTSSGKTYTMGTAGTTSDPAQEGIVPRSMALLFDLLQQQSDQVMEQSRPLSPTSSVSSFTSATQQHKSKLRPVSSRLSASNTRHSHISSASSSNQKSRYSVKVSFIEIYNEELNDLLNMAPVEERPPVTIREDTKGTIYWTGVKEVSVYNTEDVLNYLEQGTRNRATGSTDMNEKSSRSHAIFSVSLRQEKLATGSSADKILRRPASSMSVKSNTSSNRRTMDEEWVITSSKFHFVDLAGSERLKRTAAKGDRRKEGININAGLSALGNVISALGGDKKVHIPYRDSKLTRLLQDSLGGNATTLMIACASPAEHNLSETLNTLQYASRARNIRNKSEKNEMEEWMSTENLDFLRSLISKLKSEVKYLKSSKEDRSISSQSPTNNQDDEEFDEDFEQFHDQRMIIADLKRQVEELDGEATVTRERNRIVEKELQRLHALLESKSQNNDIDFAHLVEPVIEEYEKSISKLESQLAMTRAALNHTNISFEEQAIKITEMEATTQQQERTINDLRTRLSKIMEREHANETYIQELESKLIKSANDATRDQEMLNELKSRILKLKETDENTERYISSLEESISTGDMERSRLKTLVEELETKLASSTTANDNNMKDDTLILKELDHVNSKLLLAEKERDSFKVKVEQLQKKSITPTPSVSKEKKEPSATSSTKSHRSTSTTQKKSIVSNEPPISPIPSSSSTSHSSQLLLQVEKRRVQEETERANKLQAELDRLKQDHEETVKELDEVLQRYQEALEQVDDQLLIDDDNTLNSSSITSSTSSNNNKLHSIMHNEQFCVKEKQALHDHITDLEKKMQQDQDQASLKNTLLQLRNEQDEYKKKAALDLTLIQNLQDELAQLKETSKPQQVSSPDHDALMQALLEQDIKRLNKCLDDKETYVTTLESQKSKLEYEKGKLIAQRDELEQLLNESQGHSEGLRQRLKDTLASLTVLKVKYNQLLKVADDTTCEQLKKELDETVAKKESLTKLLESTLEEKRILSADILQLEDELDSLHQLHDIEKNEAEKTRKKLETLERVKNELLDECHKHSLDTNHVTEVLQIDCESAASKYDLEHALGDMASEKAKLIKTHEEELNTLKDLLLNGTKSSSAIQMNHELSTSSHPKEEDSELKVGQCPNGKQPISLELSSSFESLKKEIVLFVETNQAKDSQIEIQRNQIESMTRTIESLEKAKTEPNTDLITNLENTTTTDAILDDEKERTRQEIQTLEDKLSKAMKDNLEQTQRSESLQKEVYRITKELRATSEQHQSTVLQLAEINKLLTENIDSSDSLPITSDSMMGIQRYLAQEEQDSTADTTYFKNIKKELHDLQIKAREAADAKQQVINQQQEYQSLIETEREKLSKSQKAQHIMEKRLDELLRKKKFMCF